MPTSKIWLIFVAVNFSVFTLLGLTLGYRRLSSYLSRMGSTLHRAITLLIYTSVYFLIVPLFAIPSFLKRFFTVNKNNSQSFWISKRDESVDEEYFERSG